eukprot:SM000106S13969  [mRNA]  locus=s106:181809:182687:- [translate_table: standard]
MAAGLVPPRGVTTNAGDGGGARGTAAAVPGWHLCAVSRRRKREPSGPAASHTWSLQHRTSGSQLEPPPPPPPPRPPAAVASLIPSPVPGAASLVAGSASSAVVVVLLRATSSTSSLLASRHPFDKEAAARVLRPEADHAKLDASRIVDRRLLAATLLLGWAAALQAHMYWLQRQPGFKDRFKAGQQPLSSIGMEGDDLQSEVRQVDGLEATKPS